MSSFDRKRKVHVLLCYSGSVAAVKVPEICDSLLELGYIELKLISSGKAGNYFLSRSNNYNSVAWDRFIEKKCHHMMIYDSDEWNIWNKIGDPVLHIEIRKWADILLIAPASADLLAKLSSGISDSLLLSVARAWDFSKPCFVCPAMNTMMWNHPVTSHSLVTLQSWGWIVVDPVVKTLACNDTGTGALASVPSIIQRIEERVKPMIQISGNENGDASDITITVTAFNMDSEPQIFLKLSKRRENEYNRWKIWNMIKDSVKLSFPTGCLIASSLIALFLFQSSIRNRLSWYYFQMPNLYLKVYFLSFMNSAVNLKQS